MPGPTRPVIKAWQYSSTTGGLEKNLRLNPSVAIPNPKPDQYLVQVVAAALNPIDYKPAELPLVGRLAVRKPATPGLDFAGYLVASPSGSKLKRGQLVFGLTGTTPLAGGALSQLAITQTQQIVAVPEGVEDVTAFATIGVAGLTAYQTLVPHVKPGDRVFINGGSGGTGVFGIQIAKVLGCYVATTCSTANIELCQTLGADRVIDYKKESVVDTLKSVDDFDHVIDNVGSDTSLYWKCHEYTKPGALYIHVGGELSPAYVANGLRRRFLPGFLGGGKREARGFFAQPKPADLEQIVAWMVEGRIKPVIDSKFPFEQAPRALERLKTGRARGKIVVEVSSEPLKDLWPPARD
jgi:NADPH:quinone reductase-like Zn-dependent oxidoreductase